MLILLDIDGVLVDNVAYKVGVQHTAREFSRRLSVPAAPPSLAEIDIFESESITIEWDECAIITATLLIERLRREAADPVRRAALAALPAEVWAAVAALPPVPNAPPFAIDYGALARRVGAASRETGLLPSRAAHQLFLAELDEAVLGVARPLLHQLLDDIYAVDTSPAMQLFQNYALGDEHYAAYYQLPPHVTGPALLETLDVPLLDAKWRDALLQGRAAGEVYPVVYTARPSLAPAEGGDHARGYTPESEMARDLVGLAGVPVIGFGKLHWVAQREGRSGSTLVKPSPVQAMAAMGAAISGQELAAMEAAIAVQRGEPVRYPLTAIAGQAVHVFDDSASSLRAVGNAVARLNELGLGLTLTRHGIAPAGSPKQATLGAIAEVVHTDINAGLALVLPEAA
jgi:hypothetical protein